jgi:hypothetical protein
LALLGIARRRSDPPQGACAEDGRTPCALPVCGRGPLTSLACVRGLLPGRLAEIC